MDKNTLSHTTWECKYHIVFVPKFRRQGERVFLDGNNGCGKSSLIKSIMAQVNGKAERELNYETTGTLSVVSGLKITYISQETSHLRGTLKAYAEKMILIIHFY